MHSQDDLLEIEHQLSFPHGENGRKIAEMMNETNFEMTRVGIESLNIETKDRLLEIGHGNGHHIPFIFRQNKAINYFGLEMSETMKNEAEVFNEKLIMNESASFTLYQGELIPFSDNYFSKILTVNTLYFWINPKSFIREISRVLKPNGLCSIVFSKKEFLKTLPFVQSKFKLYSNADVLELAKESGLSVQNIGDFSDNVMSKSGDNVLRKFSVISFTK